jgi:hypothetical protein
MAELFSFPHPVNEKAARTVAAVVLVLAAVTLATSWYVLLAVLAYGFIARALTGPTLSPLGRVASQLVAPRLGPPKPVSGPPKRFAQAMGATIATAAAVLALGFGLNGLADALLVALIVAAGLESIFAYCVGCKVFGLLMRTGVIPEAVCAECTDIWSRGSTAAPASPAERIALADGSRDAGPPRRSRRFNRVRPRLVDRVRQPG